MYNKLIVIGNLTRDPELRTTAGGKEVCTLRLAVNTGYGDNKRVLYIDAIVWGKQATTCAERLTKGSQVLAEGELQERSWEKDGTTRKQNEIAFANVRFLCGKGGANSDVDPF